MTLTFKLQLRRNVCHLAGVGVGGAAGIRTLGSRRRHTVVVPNVEKVGIFDFVDEHYQLK